MKERAERKIAQLHSRLQQHKSHIHRLASDNEALAARLADASAAADAAAAQAAAAAAASVGQAGAANSPKAAAAEQLPAGAAEELTARCGALEAELRKSKRREEKLQVGPGGSKHDTRCSPDALRSCMKQGPTCKGLHPQSPYPASNLKP